MLGGRALSHCDSVASGWYCPPRLVFAFCETIDEGRRFRNCTQAMHVIYEKKLREFWDVHPEAEQPLRAWLKRTEGSAWANFAELRAD